MSNRCSYCYERGHNRLGCPKMKNDYEAGVAKQEDDRSYSDWRAIQEYEKVLQHKQKMKWKSMNRKCTYCGEKGHNRTTCPTKKRMFALHQRATRIAFNINVEIVQRTGLFIGSLMKVSNVDEPTDDRYDHKDMADQVVYFLNNVPHPTPIVTPVIREGMARWTTYYHYSPEQTRYATEFYQSEEYMKLCTLLYVSRLSYQNAKLLAGRQAYYDIHWNQRDLQGTPMDVNLEWSLYPVVGLSKDEIQKKFLSKSGDKAWFLNAEVYKKKHEISIETHNVPRLGSEDEDSKQFFKQISQDFLKKGTGYTRFQRMAFYNKKEKHCEASETLLTNYVNALSAEWENKHIKIN